MEFKASDPGQLEAIARLLQQSFRVPAEDPSVDLSYLAWKYYTEGPSWPGSRSYIMQSREGEILAHAAIWPFQLRLRDCVREGFGFGDWAASEQHPGAGLFLLKKLMTLAPLILVTGGKEITQKILPRAGFQPWADRPTYAKVLRPLGKTLKQKGSLDWKDPLRLARNTWWSLSLTASAGDWTAEEAAPASDVLAMVQGQQGSLHSLEFIRYLLLCPTIRFQFLVLRERGEVKGYSILSFVGSQARLADLRLVSDPLPDPASEARWNGAVAAVVRLLVQHPAVCEVVAFGSVPKLDKALLCNGFHLQSRVPLVVFDKRNQIAQEPVPQLGMLEDDAAIV